MQLTGIHHVTAVTAHAAANHAFYTAVMGLRLVKKTVNQDDTSAYHLFYADGLASPGSDLTFFDWPTRPERRGTKSIVLTTLRVAGQATLEWWAARLTGQGVSHGGLGERDGRMVLDFEDPEGQRLSLVDDGGLGSVHPWAASSVPVEHQIRGLGYPVLSVPVLGPTETVLRSLLNMSYARSYTDPTRGSVNVYTMADGDRPDCELHIRIEPGLPEAIQGAGAVHHIAFRTPDAAEYQAWADKLSHARLPFSGPVDRYYFRSLYLRDPNGILIEIATDGPGFATDEPLDKLGQRLALPPFLEPKRAAIEAGLTPLTTASPAA